MASDPRTVLAESIKGKTDEEILALMRQMAGSTEAALDVLFQGMAQALNPEAAQDCVIGYELKEGETTYNVAMVVKDRRATVEKREPTDARVTLGLAVPDFVRLVAGELDGMQAFMQGKLRLKGDMMFAQQIPRMFGA